MRRVLGSPASRLGLAAAIALAVPVALSACGGAAGPTAPSSPATASSTAPVPVVTPTTPPPTQDASDATAVQRACADLVPDAVAQQLSSSLAPVADWTPAAGTVAARIVALKGTACEWTDSAGDVLQVAVAKPSRHDAVALKNDLVRRSNSVPTYGGEAYFQVDDHRGRVDAFRGRTWISAVSNRFFEPGDAVAVIQSVDAALGTTPPSATSSPSATPTGSASATP